MQFYDVDTDEELAVPEHPWDLSTLQTGDELEIDLRWPDGRFGRYWRVHSREGERVGLEFVA